MGPLSALGLVGGIVGGVGGLFGNRKSNRRLEDLIKQNPTYKQNPVAGQRLALAQQLLNARMPGAASLERNIFSNQANALGQINRNATDASQALALASASQGQTNQAFNQLGIQESQDYYNRLQNLTGAQQGMIEEGDKVYQDQVRKFQDLAAIRGAQNQNRQNTWQGISNLGFGLANFGMAGGDNGLGGLFGGGGNGGVSNLSPSTYQVPMASYGSPNTNNIQLPPLYR